MNKDRVKGSFDEVAGGAKRKAGELTDNPKLQLKGMVQQAKGKAEGVFGKTTDAVNHAIKNTQDRVDPRIAPRTKSPMANTDHKRI